MIAFLKSRYCLSVVVACIVVMSDGNSAVVAQQIRVATPFQTNRDSFYERNGLNFGMNFGGSNRIVGLTPGGQLTPRISITQGSAGQTVPGFGGFNPNSPLRTGFASLGGDASFSFGLVAGKGNRRSITSQTPSVMVQNGQTGSIFSGVGRPFVTRIDPVLGGGVSLMRPSLPDLSNLDGPPPRIELDEPRTYSSPGSTATRGDLSISEIERRKTMNAELENQQIVADVQELITAADLLVTQGNFGAARAKYSRALRKLGDQTSVEELRDSLTEKINNLRDRK